MFTFDFNSLQILKHNSYKFYFLLGEKNRIIEIIRLLKYISFKNYSYENINITKNSESILSTFIKNKTPDLFNTKKILHLNFKHNSFTLHFKNKILYEFITYKNLLNYIIFFTLETSFTELTYINFLKKILKPSIIIHAIKFTTHTLKLWLQQQVNMNGYSLNYYHLKYLCNIYKNNLHIFLQNITMLTFRSQNFINININDIISLSNKYISFTLFDLIKNALYENITKSFFIYTFFKHNVSEYTIFLFLLNKEIEFLLKIKLFKPKKFLNYLNIHINKLSKYNIISILFCMLYLDLCAKQGKFEQFWNCVYDIILILITKNKLTINSKYYDKFSIKFTSQE